MRGLEPPTPARLGGTLPTELHLDPFLANDSYGRYVKVRRFFGLKIYVKLRKGAMKDSCTIENTLVITREYIRTMFILIRCVEIGTRSLSLLYVRYALRSF